MSIVHFLEIFDIVSARWRKKPVNKLLWSHRIRLVKLPATQNGAHRDLPAGCKTLFSQAVANFRRKPSITTNAMPRKATAEPPSGTEAMAVVDARRIVQVNPVPVPWRKK